MSASSPGGGPSSSNSYAYWEKFGGGPSSSNSYGYGGGYGDGYGGGYEGGPPSSIVERFGSPSTEVDIAIAWFKLIVSGALVVVGTPALAIMYRWRNVLDIRARSATINMFAAGTILLSYIAPVNESVGVLWPKYQFDWLWLSILLFFSTPILFGSYICRALRLAVVFHPRAKRRLPWLIPERNHVCFLVLMGIAFTAIPIHQHYTMEWWEIIPVQMEILATTIIVFAASLACIFPFIRKVDDLFNISTELIIVTCILVVLAAGLKVIGALTEPDVSKWAGNGLNWVSWAAVFGVSVVDPVRRVAFDPLAGAKRKSAHNVFLARRSNRSTARTCSLVVSDIEDPGDDDDRPRSRRTESYRLEDSYLDDVFTTIAEAAVAAVHSAALPRPEGLSPSPEPGAPEAGNWEYQGVNFSSLDQGASVQGGGRGDDCAGGRGGRRGGRDSRCMEAWSFDRLSRTPSLAAAFEAFSRKALCHESILFLSEVSRYESGDFSAPAGLAGPTQYEAVCRLADLFIRPGAREEVNISAEDRKVILDWVHKGEAEFDKRSEGERRTIFGRAYLEVKGMLEDNLLRRFLESDRFKNARV